MRHPDTVYKGNGNILWLFEDELAFPLFSAAVISKQKANILMKMMTVEL